MPRLAAAILAAGEGQRAWPFCGIRQKVTVPVANVPVVRRLARDLRDAGFTDTVIVTGHRTEAVRALFAGETSTRYVQQHDRRGPVDAARLAIEGLDADVVLVVAGDTAAAPETWAAMASAWERGDADMLVLAAPCPAGAPDWVNLDVAEDGFLRGVHARRSRREPRFAGATMATPDTLRRAFAMDPGIMERVGVGAMPPLEGDLAQCAALLAENGGVVRVVQAPGYCIDVNRPWDILEANRAASDHFFDALSESYIAGDAVIDDAAHIAPDAKLWLGPGARIGPGVFVRGDLRMEAGALLETGAIVEGRVMLGANTVVREHAKIAAHSVLGARNVAGQCMEFGGVTFDGVVMIHYGCVTALIGAHVDLGAATVCGTWRFDEATRPQRVGQRVELPPRYGQYTYVGDYSRTGVNAMCMPGVKIGWHCCVGPGVCLQEDLREGQLVLAKQEHLHLDWGPARYAW